ncbi:MAG TPA: SpoIIE family protein phosphatase [Solirubrobacteraceae bacterium]|nr:SpoIIE family protein phosphatase [Solirubrobacteraceae bacterium]
MTRPHAGEETAAELYEEAPCGYLSTTPDGTIVRANATFLRWTGYTSEELLGGRRFQDLLTGGGRIYHETHYAPMLRMQGRVREIALDIRRADGSRLPALINAALKTDDHGEPLLVRTTIFDATERQRYELELRAARDREQAARERADALQRMTAAVAAAPDAAAIARAVVDALAGSLGADRAGLAAYDDGGAARVLARHGDAVAADLEPSRGPRFDEGVDGERPAYARVLLSSGGVLWVAFACARPLPPEDRALLQAAAEQAGIALERALLHERSRDVAHALQQSLLAGSPPSDARFAMATAYFPAVAHLEVGGDWHDAFVLPNGRIGISVGDVVGRGLGAASAMGQLRSAVRALAGAEVGPAGVLDRLDTFVEQLVPARYATVVHAEVDPATGEVCCGSAGHLPVLVLRRGGRAELFLGGRSAPLGVPPTAPATRPQAAFTLEPGDGFLLYTDGLVERRREGIDESIARLVAVVRGLGETSAEELVRALPDVLLDEGAVHDDVCLLAFRRLL